MNPSKRANGTAEDYVAAANGDILNFTIEPRVIAGDTIVLPFVVEGKRYYAADYRIMRAYVTDRANGMLEYMGWTTTLIGTIPLVAR